jgi:hypothetical protein
LAEITGNSTFSDSAVAAVKFWQSVMGRWSLQPGCSRALVDINNTGDDCLETVGIEDYTTSFLNLDCTTYFSEGVLALSNVTRNSTMEHL